jgi:cytochrome c oxidase assembly factor CtaG
MTTGELLLSAWAPGVVVPLVCVAALAAYGHRYRSRLSSRALFFVLAVALFFVALASPIGVLARGYLFSAHMLQHLLLTLCVPPLLLLGLPSDDEDRRDPRRESTTSFASWVAGVGAMWLWHVRALCNAAAEHASVQAIQTVSLVAMGLAFWTPILSPRRSSRMNPLMGVAYLFGACVACTVLGVMVTLSPVEVCTAYMHPVDALGALPLLRDGWGMSCKADQEIGGLLMWVPTCFVYAGAILATLGKYFAEERPTPHAARGGG